MPGVKAMRSTAAIFSVCLSVVPAVAAEDYKGHFTTQTLYNLCSRKEVSSREGCNLYLQGLVYGIRTQKGMQDQGMRICLPAISSEEARIRILKLIDGITEGKPSNNK